MSKNENEERMIEENEQLISKTDESDDASNLVSMEHDAVETTSLFPRKKKIPEHLVSAIVTSINTSEETRNYDESSKMSILNWLTWIICSLISWILVFLAQFIFLIQFSALCVLLVYSLFSDEDEKIEQVERIVKPVVTGVEVTEILIYLLETILECFHETKTFKTFSSICFVDDMLEDSLTFILPVILEGIEESSRGVKTVILSVMVFFLAYGLDNRLFKMFGMCFHPVETMIMKIKQFSFLKKIRDMKYLSKLEWNVYYKPFLFVSAKTNETYPGRIFIKRKEFLIILPDIFFILYLFVSTVVLRILISTAKPESASVDVAFYWFYINGVLCLFVFRIRTRSMDIILENQPTMKLLLATVAALFQAVTITSAIFLEPIIAVIMDIVFFFGYFCLTMFAMLCTPYFCGYCTNRSLYTGKELDKEIVLYNEKKSLYAAKEDKMIWRKDCFKSICGSHCANYEGFWLFSFCDFRGKKNKK